MVVVSIIPDVIEGTSKVHGKGLFAGKQFNSGDAVLNIKDPKVSLINHSCDPSVAFVSLGESCVARAIRPIKHMMELTADYSIAATESLDMVCNCRSLKCRGVVKEYAALPKDVRERYEYMKIVPDYVLAPQ